MSEARFTNVTIIDYTSVIVSPCCKDTLQGRYKLIEDFQLSYAVRKEVFDTFHYLKIPKGFKFDGASIPRSLWSVIGSPYLPSFLTASLVHDYHCNWIDGVLPDRDKSEVTVKEISDVFYELLLKEGVGELRAKAMRQSVYLYKKWF